MANLFKERIDEAYSDWFYAYVKFQSAQIDLNAAWSLWGIPDDHKALQRTMWAVQHIIDAGSQIISHNPQPSYYPSLLLAQKAAWEYTEEEMPAITYKAICEAWGKNDFEGRAVTIAFIDRMRQILWSEPYSALWAAKPEEQGE